MTKESEKILAKIVIGMTISMGSTLGVIGINQISEVNLSLKDFRDEFKQLNKSVLKQDFRLTWMEKNLAKQSARIKALESK